MHILEYPPVPVTAPIYEGFPHHAKIDVHGNTFHGPHQGFVVELLTPAGIAMHASLRMGHEFCTVFNSMEGTMWGVEERVHSVLRPGQHFHMHVKNDHHHFTIKINGCHVAHFRHRVPCGMITAVHIRGDVTIEKIHFEGFRHHNHGGGVYVAPAPVVVAAPPPPVIMAAPAPTVIIEEHGHHHHHGLLHHLLPHHHHHHHHGHHHHW